jgi:N-acetylmuramoyl-L-alanine amidase
VEEGAAMTLRYAPGATQGNRRVALDAGHGASRGRAFTGAHGNGLVEDDLALDFVTRIGHHLRLAGYDTVIARPDGKLVALATRGKRALDGHCDLFVSIHLNAGPASANGVEVFVAEGDTRSRALAERLVEAISTHGLRNRGAKWDSQSQYSRLRVLRDTYRHMPAVLLEIGFLTSAHDARLLADKHWRGAVAGDPAHALAQSVP